MEGFPDVMMGYMMSAFFAGFILGAIACKKLIGRTGQIRVIAAICSVATAAMLLHLLVVDAYYWIGFRFLSGFCSAALCIIIESWLSGAGGKESRSRVLSVYMVLTFLATSCGQMVLAVVSPESYVPFVIGAMMFSLSLIPVVMSKVLQQPPVAAGKSVDFGKTFGVAPLAAIGTLCMGLTTSAFTGLAGVYAVKVGLAPETISVFMTSLLVGGLISQYPVGMLADRFLKRHLIAIGVSGGAGVCFIIATLPTGGAEWLSWALPFLAGVLGLLIVPMNGLCIAHANNYVQPDELVTINSTLKILSGIGAVIGPTLGAQMMDVFGPRGLFLWMMLSLGIIVLYYLSGARMPAVDLKNRIMSKLPPLSMDFAGISSFALRPLGDKASKEE